MHLKEGNGKEAANDGSSRSIAATSTMQSGAQRDFEGFGKTLMAISTQTATDKAHKNRAD